MATILDVPQGNRIAAGVNRALGSILNFFGLHQHSAIAGAPD
jgi:hypothetical protein